MAKTSVELREERAGIISEARKKWQEAEAREGGPTAEDQAAFDAAMDGADKMLERAKRLERLETAEADLDTETERQSDPLDGEARDRRDREERGEAGDRAEVADYRHWMMTGETRPALRKIQQRAAGILAEVRDTIISTDSKGGYLVTPTKVSDDIVRLINDQVFIRNLATVTRVTEAKKLGIRKITTRMADANWTTEVQAVTEDTTLAFDRRDLEPYLLSKLAKVSIRTLMLAADAESIINEELAYKFGITEEKAFLNGDGSSKPLGVFSASANGISTARDVSTGNTSTAITADGLIEAKFSVKQGYLQDERAAWIFHRDAVKRIRKLKVASTGGNDLEYLWQPGLTEGAPDRILDVPYYMSEYAPNTFTTGLYVGILGNFRYYRIAELNAVMMQRLVELYAGTNEVGFIGRRWVDGGPVLEEAFARVKLA